MKIEIAESLIYSHLKHNEGCRIVQTNWMTSGKWIVTETEKERAKVLFDKISRSEFFKDTFKNSSFDQLIKQAEIDVLGINTTENTIYGIDIAFHSAGLNYGSKYETAQIVLKKIFRTVFIMQTFFHENDKFHSYFITPKVNPATPYSTFQTVEVPASVHPISAESKLTVLTVRSIGSGHVGIPLTLKLSTKTSISSGSSIVPSEPRIPN